MSELYVPNYSDSNCAYVYNENVIRVYDTHPTNNSNVHYYDYFFNSHYIMREGTTQFNQYSTLPVCHTNVTTNFYYRCDITEIIIITLIFISITWFLVSKLIKSLFKGGKIK